MPRSIFTVPAMALLTLSISACQPKAEDTNNTAVSKWSCQTQSSPFNYSACRIDAAALSAVDAGDRRYSLQLFWQQPDSAQSYLSFDNLLANLPSSQTLAFAMNAGMYNERYAPIGYTVIGGKEIRALNLNEGGGNFHLLPNGVMWWDKAGNIQITESHALQQQLEEGSANPWFATQSGPMLVINNEIHPKFNADGTSAKFRNGAGVCSDGSIQFVNSDEPVTFYQFASLFKDKLQCPNALFLDGGIASALYAPTIDKHDKKEMGVMIGVVETKNNANLKL
ncbi:phosphodiester glycosidase family protein [Psychrobacter urativorans]|uniref:phosphodiester glycosidase family protein n=1 Tax=Psychrobacter urativorans TaxID=45610 RepID=UPI001917E0AA|nr:phosphodiester glycosidase family protein [Psychrobacter urativorans]